MTKERFKTLGAGSFFGDYLYERTVPTGVLAEKSIRPKRLTTEGVESSITRRVW